MKNLPPPPSAATRGRPPIDERALLEGILWKIATQSPWYHMPSVYPSWQTCYRRYNKWKHNGLLMTIITLLDYDLQDRGGLDFEAAAKVGILDLDYVNDEFQIKYPLVLQDTWQLKTALIFMGLRKKQAEIIFRNPHFD